MRNGDLRVACGGVTPPAPPLPGLVDSHCHLTWPSLLPDVAAIVDRMHAAGVEQAVVVATSPENSVETRALCKGRPGLFPTAGLHPNDVPERWDPGTLETVLREGAGAYCAVGETGLDYYRDAVERAPQRDAFEAQIAMAKTPARCSTKASPTSR